MGQKRHQVKVPVDVALGGVYDFSNPPRKSRVLRSLFYFLNKNSIIPRSVAEAVVSRKDMGVAGE